MESILMTYHVAVLWDAEASVWGARSDDVPGLVAEAATFEGLIEDIRALVPELLELNHVPVAARIDVALIGQRAPGRR